MSRIVLAVVLLIGIVVGSTVVPQFLGESPTADSLCNQQLDGDGWSANLQLSKDVNNGTRLVCERGGEQRELTVDVSIDVDSGGEE